MGFYWTTVFIKDKNDKSKKIVLENIDPIIGKNDTFVLKTELLQYYSHLINEEDITENSLLEEYTWSTIDPNDKSFIVTKSLPIQ
jgi:hypothetical protein